MRAVVQRVLSANVTVGQEQISSIGKGLCVLIGISRNDTKKDIEYVVKKILNLRLFDDEGSGKRWHRSVRDAQLEVLCVSQFTLYGILKGNKLDFHLAMAPEHSQTFYDEFLHHLKQSYNPELVKDGKFGALMKVNIENDGPVTVNLESPSREEAKVNEDSDTM